MRYSKTNLNKLTEDPSLNNRVKEKVNLSTFEKVHLCYVVFYILAIYGIRFMANSNLQNIILIVLTIGVLISSILAFVLSFNLRKQNGTLPGFALTIVVPIAFTLRVIHLFFIHR
ncbi:MAG: hypothetical protein RR967_02465 [Anaerovoracaceae bacterium]